MQTLELGKKRQDLTLDVFCRVRFAMIKSCLVKCYYDILAKTCHFLTGLDFTAAWPPTLLQWSWKRFIYQRVGVGEKKQNKKKHNINCLEEIQHSQTLRWHCSPTLSWSLEAVSQLWLWCSENVACVASSFACCHVFTMLLSRGLTELCLSLYA